jgi:hypothetical protein
MVLKFIIAEVISLLVNDVNKKNNKPQIKKRMPLVWCLRHLTEYPFKSATCACKALTINKIVIENPLSMKHESVKILRGCFSFIHNIVLKINEVKDLKGYSVKCHRHIYLPFEIGLASKSFYLLFNSKNYAVTKRLTQN